MDLSPFKLDIDELINEFVEVFTWICYLGLFLLCLAIVFQEGYFVLIVLTVVVFGNC
jgi:ABC-type dipeptide/oligopeptide/nickel transport system permease subunit